MPAVSSVNRYSSYTASVPTYPSYLSAGSSFLNRTTSLDRSSYALKSNAVPTKHAPSSSYLNGNYTSRFTSALPPRPTYSSEAYRSSRNTRISPARSSRISSESGGLSETSRYSSGCYRESSSSRDSGYSSRYTSKEPSADSELLRRRASADRRRESINDIDKIRVSDRIRGFDLTKSDPIEERLAQRRRRLGLSPVKDILSNRSSRFTTSEPNGNDVDSDRIYRKYNGTSHNINATSPSNKYSETNGYANGSRSKDARKSSLANSLRRRTDSSNSEDSKSSDILRPGSPIVKPSSSTDSILASIRDAKTVTSRPPSPPPQPRINEPTSIKTNCLEESRARREKRSSAMQERIAARLKGDGDEGSLRKRNPTGSSTESFSENNGLVGLRNIGNTCFLNSITQCLSNTPCLMEYLVRADFSSDINTTLSTMKGDLIRAFSSLMIDMWRDGASENGRALNTGSFKAQIQKFAPAFNGYAQHDAQEFLRKLLEGLHEDVNRVAKRPTPINDDIDDALGDNQIAMESWKRYLRYDDSKVVDMFVGQLKSSLQCSVCGHRSVTFDPFWDLSLPIPSRTGLVQLTQCLDLFTKEEVLDNDERPTCSRCKERRKMTKTLSIHKFPKVLVIHLKRFSPTERFRGKLNGNVEFPLEALHLARYASNSSASCLYNLTGVANHSGTALSGHYTAYCRHPYLSTWHEYNDGCVSSMASNMVCSAEAYVLFYELTTS